jgi:hypothetical protein
MKCAFSAIVAFCWMAVTAQAGLMPIGHWKFDEASGATTAVDSVTPGKNGVVGSGVTTGLTGIAGNAYQFPGGANADDAAPNPEIVDFDNALTVIPSIVATNQISISAWLNWTNNTAARGTAISIASNTVPPAAVINNNFISIGVTDSVSGQNTEGGIYGGINIASVTTEVVNTTGFNDGGSLVHASDVPVGGGTALNDGNWHHVVMTIDSATDILKLYVDGVDVGTGRPAANPPNPPGTPANINNFPTTLNNLEVGRLGRSTECCSYEGMIDDIQIYDRVLSPESIASLFANPGSVAALEGDYNNDSKVDAADYIVWRKNYGSPTSLPNDPSPGVGDDDYDRWRQNFGSPPAGLGAGSIASVPEPCALAGGFVLLLTGVALSSRKRLIAASDIEGQQFRLVLRQR